MIRTLLPLFVLAVVLCVLPAWATLNPKRVRLVDYNPTLNNYIFRCNMPKTSDGEFAYDLLIQYMNDVSLSELNRPLPSDIYLIDVSLLNAITDFADLAIEKDYFAAHPEHGRLLHWPIIGNLENPHMLKEELLKDLATRLDEWQWDKLPQRVPALNLMLNTNFTRPTALVVHCAAGVDRTGEVCGSYYMEFLKWTYTKTLDYNYDVVPRRIERPSENALGFYCWHLYYTKGGFPKDCNYQPNATAIATN